MDQNPVKFTVCISTFNAAQCIETCINSIVSQTYAHFEILIQDGASRDETIACLEKYDDPRISIQSAQDTGIYNAWNAIIPRISGDYIVFLGADDRLWDQDVFLRLSKILADQNRDQAVMIYGQSELHDDGGRCIVRFGEKEYRNKNQMLEGQWLFGHTGLLYSRQCFNRVPEFDESYKSAGDFVHVTHCLKAGGVFQRVECNIAVMSEGGISTNANSAAKGLAEVVKARRALCIHPIMPHWLAWLLIKAKVKQVLYAISGRLGQSAIKIFRRIT